VLSEHELKEAKMRKWLALLMPLLLAGCMDYQEELWINPDGSGKLLINLQVNETSLALVGLSDEIIPFTRDSLEALLGSTPDSRLVGVRQFTSGDDRVFEATIEFDSLGVLTTSREENTSSGFGTLFLSLKNNAEMVFTRTIQAPYGDDDSEDRPPPVDPHASGEADRLYAQLYRPLPISGRNSQCAE